MSDLLHVGQVGEDRLQLQRTRVDLAVLVEEAVEATRPFAEKRGMAVEVEAPPQLSASVDAQRIRQVLDNPLSNAVQYNGAGGTVSVVLRHDEDAIELAVSDTGMGIVQDEVEHVFGRFFRGGAALEKHIPAPGSGSTSSTPSWRPTMELTLESEVGRGSTLSGHLAPPDPLSFRH